MESSDVIRLQVRQSTGTDQPESTHRNYARPRPNSSSASTFHEISTAHSPSSGSRIRRTAISQPAASALPIPNPSRTIPNAL